LTELRPPALIVVGTLRPVVVVVVVVVVSRSLLFGRERSDDQAVNVPTECGPA
jgi:hypothetical protein